MSRTLLAVCAALLVGALAYSIVRVTAADATLGPLFAILGTVALSLLVGVGVLNPDEGGKGPLGAAFHALPRATRWLSKSRRRSAVFVLSAAAIAAGAIVLGPASIERVIVQCGEAKFVAFERHGERAKCDHLAARETWRPLRARGSAHADVTCIGAGEVDWKPETGADGLLACGAARYQPRHIKNGVDIAGLDVNTFDGRRTRAGVLALRAALAKEIPERNLDDVLLLATWNIRELGGNRFKRVSEAFHYIAEIISHFDVVAVQEVKGELEDLQKVLAVLGSNWGVVYSLVSPGQLGNRERMVFIYDKRKVALGNRITSIAVPGEIQLARTPFLVTLHIGKRALAFCNVHIIYGRTGRDGDEQRVKEVKSLAESLIAAFRHERGFDGELLVLGDFNSLSPKHPVIAALQEAGFHFDPRLAAIPSNFAKSIPYDQIAVLAAAKERLVFNRVGAFDFFAHVFRTDQREAYSGIWRTSARRRGEEPNGSESQDEGDREYDSWRTHQMSDHLPKWAEIVLR